MTTNDDTSELAAAHRDARDRLAPWQALAAGELDAAAAERAARAAGHSDEEIARAKELFAPIDLEATIARLERSASVVDDDGVPSIAAHRRPSEEVADVLPIRKPWFLPSVAAAAVVLVTTGLWWNARQTPAGQAASRGAATMVDHELAIVGVAEVRGDAAAVASVPAGGNVRFVLRPMTRHEIATVVWACAVRDSEHLRLEIDLVNGEAGGALQASVAIPATMAKGEWDLVAFVASEPTSENDDAACEVEPSPSVKLAKAPLLVR